jgi:hypothetical protein
MGFGANLAIDCDCEHSEIVMLVKISCFTVVLDLSIEFNSFNESSILIQDKKDIIYIYIIDKK